MPAAAASPAPVLPMGERLELPGRGTTFLRRVPGPRGSPTVVLLHGWIASGGLNWFTAFDSLSRHYDVVAPDLRGHGRGLRSRRRFRLADCADDVAATLEQLGTGPAIAVGYSMGGPVAQLLWRRHPHLVAGLVLCATSDRFVAGQREKLIFGSVMAAALGTTRMGRVLAYVPVASVRRWGRSAGEATRPTTLQAWARAEMRRHDVVKLMEAGQAIGSYDARRWVGQIDVPTTVLVTTRDGAVEPWSQRRMAADIPGAQVQELHDGHVACAKRSFGPALLRAVDSVARRLDQPAAASL